MRLTLLLAAVLFLLPAAASRAADVDFAREILPILADKCFQCHGPDAANREADLRLDQEASAKAERDGRFAIRPGDPAGSELVRRIESDDEFEQMPPADSGRTLTAQQRAKLREWIEQGAAWGAHWAFQPPVATSPPANDNDRWSHNGVDRFVYSRLTKEGLEPNPQATKTELIRRATFDLTGLPPTIEEVEAFLQDHSPDAYERLIDRLFASPRYGEHMARMWLDAARYADTDGYQNDGPRSMWRWRDWVIEAYNRHATFDQFTIEQLAGDLLPNATFEQRLATGFNRNHRYNSEAGLVLEEFLLENAVDRVDTTSTVWMGLTMGCARCHDHKYDPFSQREYYQLIAFFDNIPESGRAVKFGNSEPWLIAPTRSQQTQQRRHDERVAGARQAMLDATGAVDAELRAIQSEAKRPRTRPAPVVQAGLKTHHDFDDESSKAAYSFVDGKFGRGIASNGNDATILPNAANFLCQSRFTISFWLHVDDARDGVILSQQSANTRRPGLAVELKDGRLQFFLITRWVAGVGAVETRGALPTKEWVHVSLTNDGSQSATGMHIAINGRRSPTSILYNTNSNTGGSSKGAKLRFGAGVHGGAFRGRLDDLRVYNRTLFEDEIRLIAAESSIEEMLPNLATLDEAERAVVRAWYWEHHSNDSLRALWRRYAQARRERQAFVDSLPTSMVMVEMDPPRTTFVRERGEYHRRKAVVPPATPNALGATRPTTNRLEFAHWLVDPEHPLTARVAVNRHWQQFFGRGLVNTAEDFGVQGEAPSHPRLLDWLAVEYVRSGWNTRRLQRLILSSAAYRQSSRVSKTVRSRDPNNVWISRGPRLRLSAHELRDQALYVSGLLVERRGGPSVSPYQPANLWRELSNMTYRRSKGADLYRRSLYTIWKRTIAPPTMSVLDAADRETCAVRPKRTNTSIQALTLLNETAFVEAARGLARRMIREGGDDPLAFGFQAVTARRPNAAERELLADALDESLKEFGGRPKLARQLINIGESKPDAAIDPPRLAAFTVVANMLFNLDETLTKQ